MHHGSLYKYSSNHPSCRRFQFTVRSQHFSSGLINLHLVNWKQNSWKKVSLLTIIKTSYVLQCKNCIESFNPQYNMNWNNQCPPRTKKLLQQRFTEKFILTRERELTKWWSGKTEAGILERKKKKNQSETFFHISFIQQKTIYKKCTRNSWIYANKDKLRKPPPIQLPNRHLADDL